MRTTHVQADRGEKEEFHHVFKNYVSPASLITITYVSKGETACVVPVLHVHRPVTLSQTPMLEHSAELCASSTPWAMSTQALSNGHNRSEQSPPVYPAKHIQTMPGLTHLPWPLQLLGHTWAFILLILLMIKNNTSHIRITLFLIGTVIDIVAAVTAILNVLCISLVWLLLSCIDLTVVDAHL